MDPALGARLHALRTARGISLRALAGRVHVSRTHVWNLEHGRTDPDPQIVDDLDAALDAAGELSALARQDDHRQETVTWAADHPRAVDSAAVDALADLLAGQRRLEDAVGSQAVLAPATAQLDTVTRLVHCCPDTAVRPRLVDVASQWAQFAAWLHTTTGDHAAGQQWYARALDWAYEAGNADMAATALNMRGHLAWITGQTQSMVQLSRAAGWQPASRTVRAVAIQQEARGLAILGDAAGVDDRLARAEALAHEAAQCGDQPPWLYFFDTTFLGAQQALAHQYLGRHERALALLSDALDGLPAAIRESDWIGWYVAQLAGLHHAVGDRDQAAVRLDEARQIADRAGAARLQGEVVELERRLGG